MVLKLAPAFDWVNFCDSFLLNQDGVVALSQNTMRFFAVDKLGDSFHQTIVPLRHTPRKALLNSEFNTLVVLESDHRSSSHHHYVFEAN